MGTLAVGSGVRGSEQAPGGERTPAAFGHAFLPTRDGHGQQTPERHVFQHVCGMVGWLGSQEAGGNDPHGPARTRTAHV